MLALETLPQDAPPQPPYCDWEGLPGQARQLDLLGPVPV